jgi:hypothetical protein
MNITELGHKSQDALGIAVEILAKKLETISKHPITYKDAAETMEIAHALIRINEQARFH